jgi:hemoglobin
MTEPTLPSELVEARRTPLFDYASLPDQLAESHRTTVWAELIVQSGTVRYTDLAGDTPRDIGLGPGDTAVIAPGVEHRVEPATDATFFIQFYRAPEAPMVPGLVEVDSRRRSGPWEHRGRDLDTAEEIAEMVVRQYVDVVQDELLEPYFNFAPGFIDWQAHIESVADYWCHVLLYAPSYEIDIIEIHRSLHDTDAFTPELFDRWLEVFDDTIDGGWAGPHADQAKKRATGMAWAMAQRFLGKGTWRPAQHR